MKFLITGGLGFIGRNLVRRLSEDPECQLTLIDNLNKQVHGPKPDYPDITHRSNVEFIHADICDSSIVEQSLKEVDVVFHLAAETGTGQSAYAVCDHFRTNTLGTATLLEGMIRSRTARPRHLVLASSRAVYGEGAYIRAQDTDEGDPERCYPGAREIADMEQGRFDLSLDGTPLVPVATRETDPPNPQSQYAVSKLAQEQMCKVACDALGIGFTALRLQNVYGVGQSLRNPYTGIIAVFVNQLRQGMAIELFEDGKQIRDFVFVDDVVSVLCAAFRRKRTSYWAINVGSGLPVNLQELVMQLAHKLGLDAKCVISGRYRNGDVRHSFADIARMKELLDLEQPTSLQNGISATVDWAMTQPQEADRSGDAMRELEEIFRYRGANADADRQEPCAGHSR